MKYRHTPEIPYSAKYKEQLKQLSKEKLIDKIEQLDHEYNQRLEKKVISMEKLISYPEEWRKNMRKRSKEQLIDRIEQSDKECHQLVEEMVERIRQETVRLNDTYFKASLDIHNKFYDKFYRPEGKSSIELEDIVNDERLYGEAVDYCREYYNYLKG